jgi:WD40 repeat protein
MRHKWIIISALLAAVAAVAVRADEGGPVSYYRELRPVFQARCQGCHQPAKPSGEFVMTPFDRLLRGGESEEAAIVPGNPDESHLLEVITPENGAAYMPPEGDPLSDQQRQLIRRWIQQGARDDTPPSARKTFDTSRPPVYPSPPMITALDYSPDGQLLAVSGYHEVLLHKADGSGLVGRLVGLSERVESAVFSPDGKRLAVAGGSPGRMGELQIWSVGRRELNLSLPVAFDNIYGACWSKDGERIAFGCPDHSVRVVDADTGKQLLLNKAHSDWVFNTAFSLQDTHLISVSRDGSAKLVELETQRFVANITAKASPGAGDALRAIDRHPERDQVVVAGADGVPKIFRVFRENATDLGDKAHLVRKLPTLPGTVFDVEFSADGNRVVAGSTHQGRGFVRIYDAASGKLVAEMAGQEAGVFALSLSPDGKQVASGGFDGRVRINDAVTGQRITEFVPVPIP